MSTLTTKRALASALKQKLKEKPLEKVTVKDICEECEVNRQTFYYHFQDIYDLVEWIYTNETDQILHGNTTYQTWEEGFSQILQYALKERSFVTSTYHSISREHLEQYLYQETYQLLYNVINEIRQEFSCQEDDVVFLADFYKYAFVGIILDWVKKGMKESPNHIIKQTSIVMEGTFRKALYDFQQLHRTASPHHEQ